MSADVKANINQQEIKDPVANVYKRYLQNLKHNIKWRCIFHSILVGMLFILTLSVRNREREGRGLLNGQNLLSMEKVICNNPLAWSKVCIKKVF